MAEAGLNLGRRVGGVAEMADLGQVLVVAVGARQAAGPEEGKDHGAAGGETHPPALIGGGIQLGEAGP